MNCYLKPTERKRRKIEPFVTFNSQVLEKTIDENGNIVQTIKEVDNTVNPLEGLDARNFELDPIIASGATGLLKQMPLLNGSNLSKLDAVDSHLSYVESLKNENNG